MKQTCVYCGALADTLDHVVPRSVFRRASWTASALVLPRSLAEDPVRPAGVQLADWTVPACSSCNSMAGSRVDASLAARIERVRTRRATGKPKRRP